MTSLAAKPLAVQLSAIAKRFGDCIANEAIDLRVEAGTIHGIIGENGAGKSTAMKMLYGQYPPDTGEIFVFGEKKAWRSPMDAIAAGLGMVHQHFMLASPYTVLENIVLGAETSRSVWRWLPRFIRPIDLSSARARLELLMKRYHLEVDLDATIESLPVGIQQRVEILKLLYRDARILILDEPTAVLTPQEITELFKNLRVLKSEGKTILIITHKLKEVMEITDRVTCFRAGRISGEVTTRDSSPEQLAELMVGRKVLLTVEVPPQPPLGAPALELVGLSRIDVARPLNSLNLSIRAGEVVGIAGIEGNGQTELLRAILHPADPLNRSAGQVKILGHDVSDWPASRIRDLGVAVVPEDRHVEGLLLERPAFENFLLGIHRDAEFTRFGLMSRSAVRASTARAMEAYDVRPRKPDMETGRMSGGNQQKLIIAREFERNPKFVIAAQPTRGVDVGAIEFIHRRILQARGEGAGVLLISSELDEVLALSDRILVLFHGKFVGEFQRGQASDRELGLLMGGAQTRAGAAS